MYGIVTFIFERPMTGFIVSSGIVVGVIGLAMQSSLSDLIAGVAIGIERPFAIGEWVELDDGTIGEVKDLNWRATHILSRHNCLYILPNARISGARHGIVPSAVTREVILRHGLAEEIPEPSPHDLFAEVELFAPLDEESRRTLVAGMEVHSFPSGAEIVKQGDEGASLFAIAAGMVGVVITNSGGHAQQVARLGAGQYFGEMSLLVGDPRTATIVALTPCQVLEIDKPAIKPIFDRYPVLINAMARIVSERRLSNQTLEADLTSDDLASRLNALAATLLERMTTIFR